MTLTSWKQSTHHPKNTINSPLKYPVSILMRWHLAKFMIVAPIMVMNNLVPRDMTKQSTKSHTRRKSLLKQVAEDVRLVRSESLDMLWVL